MNTTEVKALFRSYCDDDDTSFLTDANVELYCKLGYYEFRQITSDIDPSIYVEQISISMGGKAYYDLSDIGNPTVIMGSGPLTAPRLVRLQSVFVGDPATGIPSEFVKPAVNWEDLNSGDSTYRYKYLLRSAGLMLSSTSTDTLILAYSPEPNVDWVGIDKYIDNLPMFHDVIALLAYKQYAIRDNADNAQVLRNTASRLNDLRMFLMQGMSVGANNVVLDVDNDWS